MQILALDDEPIMLTMAVDAIKEAAPDAELLSYTNPLEALEALKKDGLHPDICFSDIEMPDLSGLEFAIRLKQISPETRIVFVTGYNQYAYDAFQVRAQGFILKPLEPAQVREELSYLQSQTAGPIKAADAPHVEAAVTQAVAAKALLGSIFGNKNVKKEKLRVKCFGHFEVYHLVNGVEQPLVFQRKQSKELFAYLIDREGALCNAEEISAALWEGENDLGAAKSRIRLLIHDLRATLREIGMEDILIREHRQLGIHKEMVDCDYWNMLHGDMEALNTYRGQYMSDYSWAEITEGKLFFQHSDD